MREGDKARGKETEMIDKQKFKKQILEIAASLRAGREPSVYKFKEEFMDEAGDDDIDRISREKILDSFGLDNLFPRYFPPDKATDNDRRFGGVRHTFDEALAWFDNLDEEERKAQISKKNADERGSEARQARLEKSWEDPDGGLHWKDKNGKWHRIDEYGNFLGKPASKSRPESSSKSDSVKNLDPEKQIETALKNGAVAVERGACYALFEQRRNEHVKILKGELGYQEFWTFIVMASKIMEAMRPKSVFASPKELEEASRYLGELSPADIVNESPSVEFTDSDFRRILGKPEYSSANIERIVERVACIILKVSKFRGLKFPDEKDRDHWEEYSSTFTGPIAMLRVDKREKKRRGLGHSVNEERLYTFYFNSEFGLAFWQNLLLRGISLLPKSFLELSGSAQELLMAFLWDRKSTYLTLEEGFRVLRWKWDLAHLWDRRKRFEGLLIELEDKHFIKSWMPPKRGKHYCIHKEKKLMCRSGLFLPPGS
jgi:hypothetical protein